MTSVLNVVGPHCECHYCNVARFDCEINVKVIVMFLILMGFLLAILRGIGMYSYESREAEGKDVYF